MKRKGCEEGEEKGREGEAKGGKRTRWGELRKVNVDAKWVVFYGASLLDLNACVERRGLNLHTWTGYLWLCEQHWLMLTLAADRGGTVRRAP